MSPSKPKNNHASDRGFTLIELVVVLMIFALVATLGLQALTGTLRNRDHLSQLDEKTTELTVMLTLLRADLQAAVPLVFYAPGGVIESAFVIAPAQDRLAFSVSGRLDLPGESSAGLSRVVWQYDAADKRLSRQSWPVLIPADASLLSPAVVVAENVTSMHIRTMTPNAVWIKGSDQITSGTAAALPRAVDVIVTTDRFGSVSTLVSYP